MSGNKSQRDILGIFAHTDCLMQALGKARDEGIEIRDVYSPVPNEEVLEFLHPKRSPVRFATFIGGVSGLVGGLALTLFTSMIWNLVVSGKPVTSVIPFLIVGFEGTILFGAIGTLLALLATARLPNIKFPTNAYRPEFSDDRFGLWLTSPSDKVDFTLNLLKEAGAVDVENLQADKEETKVKEEK